MSDTNKANETNRTTLIGLPRTWRREAPAKHWDQ